MACLSCLAVAGLSCPAGAHHEAIFAPQSSLFLSTDRFLGVQAFSKQTGRTQETTTLVSVGVSPLNGVPLTFTAIAPYSFITGLDGEMSKSGFEDLIVGARYRYDLKGLQER